VAIFSAKLSASKIQTRLLEASNIKKWREYLDKVTEILQSIDECAKEVKDIQTSILVRVFRIAGGDN
jgi:flagellin-specific chaperone FliS